MLGWCFGVRDQSSRKEEWTELVQARKDGVGRWWNWRKERKRIRIREDRGVAVKSNQVS